jgi:hypothetical protein
MGKNTKSTVAFRSPASFRYCYLTNCWTANADIGPDGSMSIQRGKNYFEFSSPEPGVMKGRFWFDISPPVHAPDATITMKQTF